MCICLLKYDCFLPSCIYFLTLMVLVKTLVQVPEKLLHEAKSLTQRFKYQEGIYFYTTGRELFPRFKCMHSYPDILSSN